MLETFQGHKSPRGSEGVSALEQDEDPLTAGTGSQKGPRRGSRRPIPQGTRTGEGRKVWSQGGRASVETKTSLVQHRQVRAQPGVPTFPGSDPGNLLLAGCLGQGFPLWSLSFPPPGVMSFCPRAVQVAWGWAPWTGSAWPEGGATGPGRSGLFRRLPRLCPWTSEGPLCLVVLT